MKLMRLLAAFTLLAASSATVAATDNEELQSLVDQLKALTQKARQQRAADRWLLNAMEDLAAKYDWPWRDELVYEDFSDGDFRQDPQWQPISGQFWVDGRLGLRSRTEAALSRQPEQPQRWEKQDLGKALLGALLQEALKGDKRKPEPDRATTQRGGPAEIHLPLSIPGVFSVQTEFSLHNAPAEQGEIEFGLYQNPQGSSGYRLVLYTGKRSTIELLSLRGGRTTIIDAIDLPEFGIGQPHELAWRRSPNGQITILFDGEQLSQTRDHSFRHPFKRFVIKNVAGDLAVQSVAIHGGG